MQEEINEFVEALYRFVANEIKRVTDPIYCQEGIKIVDARNHIFRLTDTSRTDEAEDTYALPDLCIIGPSPTANACTALHGTIGTADQT